MVERFGWDVNTIMSQDMDDLIRTFRVDLKKKSSAQNLNDGVMSMADFVNSNKAAEMGLI
ncbi:MAG: hypothetical protein ABF709_04900 [Leuconostoc pseudomesenteroides]|uniref:hypothetical protein n=1 Tax=Leuconostoc pseudomesenteroides TaxID=33968 RepID=UPI001E299074|nr:hypothetical protein [Leuconostoc pseudomesenteroides]MCC7668944.1 hypothetical protein [Leuconostoc pseudomesenteroides]